MPLPERVLNAVLDSLSVEGSQATLEWKAIFVERQRTEAIVTRWIDEAGEVIGTERPFQPQTAHIEGFRTDGTIDMLQRLVAPALGPLPAGGHLLEFRSRSGLLASVERAELEIPLGPMPDVAPKCWPEHATGDLFFPVFSERFVDQDRFYQHVDALNELLRRIAPFNDPEIGNRLQVRGYYWPSPTQNLGWFQSPDIPFECGSSGTSLFYGNRDLAKARLKHLMYKQKYGLVLVDSPYRGGAGGQDEYSYPAWSTVTSCPGEDWRAIAIHEVGHAFGLGDEYVLDSMADKVTNGEPNIGINQNDPPASWQPTEGWANQIISEDQQLAMNANAPGTEAITGFFQGARYRHDYCRPSLNCLMRAIVPIPTLGRYAFCKVCETALADALKNA